MNLPTLSRAPSDAAAGMIMFGWLIGLGGLVGVYLALKMDVTASYSSTLNIGLLQDQEMAFHGALVAILVGAMLLVGGYVAEALKVRR